MKYTKIEAVEKKISNHDVYITNQEFNKLTSENFAGRLAQTNLATKKVCGGFVKQTDFDAKIKNINRKVTK